MKFTKVITNVELDPKIIAKAEEKLTKVFMDLASGSSKQYGTCLGGSPFIYILTYPMIHVCSYFVSGKDNNDEPIFSVPTAGTTGKMIYWNPVFVNEHDLFGLRFFMGHEALHSWYFHTKRRGSRNPKLWNIAIDYIVNQVLMDDLTSRGCNPDEKLKASMGQFCSLKHLEDMIVNKKIPQELGDHWFYGDSKIAANLRTPEKLYDYIHALLKDNNYLPDDLEENCLDSHMPIEETEKETIKRMLYASQCAKQMAGSVPGGLEEELGELIKPKIRWQDSINLKINNVFQNKNDWTRFRSRPMFCGLLDPKKRGVGSTFCCCLDSSGSMSSEDFIYGVSQLQGLSGKSNGHIVNCDAQCYWEDLVKLNDCKKENLKNIKIKGRSGTQLSSFFSEYEKNVGECDFLIVITDGYLCDIDISEMRNPGIPVYWLITSTCNFKPPFGKLFNLRN